jgi:hypothetical protein
MGKDGFPQQYRDFLCANSGEGSWKLEQSHSGISINGAMAGTQDTREGFLPGLRVSCGGVSATSYFFIHHKKGAKILKYLKYASCLPFAPANTVFVVV